MPRPEPGCRLKAARFSLPVLHFDNMDVAVVSAFIREQVQRARSLLEDASILLAPDESLAGAGPEDIQALVQACRGERLFPVGLAQVDAAEHWQSHSQLRVFHTGNTAVLNASTAKVTARNRFLQQMVRSGQQAMVAEGALTVLANVSATAEVLARDDIHIYGTLKGKALAGIQGNADARIICQRFEAELVAIAGHYRLFDEPDPAWFGKPVCVRLENDQLVLQVFGNR